MGVLRGTPIDFENKNYFVHFNGLILYESKIIGIPSTDEILNHIKILQKKEKITVILVSHSMEDIAKLVERIIVMSKGKIIYTDTPDHVFKEIKMLEDVGLGVPQVSYLMRELRGKGFQIEDTISVEEAKNMILKALRGRKNA